jgi:hypothetical protein
MTMGEARRDERGQSIQFHAGRVENGQSVLFRGEQKAEKKYNEKIEATSCEI